VEPNSQPKPVLAYHPQTQDSHWPAIIAGFLGWMLDAFDYFLVTLTLTDIAAEFHESHERIAFSLTITLAFRPVGALIFGLMADRYGRRLPMIIDLIFYSAVEVCTGLAPNYATFMILRALFGIGMGGEWGVGATLAMEKVPPRWRGVLSGLLQEGYAAGYLVAAACYGLFPHRLGWRPLFFIGGVPALLALFIRFGVKESQVWERTRHHNWNALGREIMKNAKLFFYLMILMAGMNLCSHGTQDMYPTFLKSAHGFTQAKVGWVIAIMQIGAITGGIAVGLLSDRIGRRVAISISLALAILIIPLWAFSYSITALILGAFLIQFMVQGAWGVIPAHITELSPDSVRGFLPGFSYQCGALIAGLIPFVQTILAKQISYTRTMALTACAVFIYTIIVILSGSEKRGQEFGVAEVR